MNNSHPDSEKKPIRLRKWWWGVVVVPIAVALIPVAAQFLKKPAPMQVEFKNSPVIPLTYNTPETAGPSVADLTRAMIGSWHSREYDCATAIRITSDDNALFVHDANNQQIWRFTIERVAGGKLVTNLHGKQFLFWTEEGHLRYSSSDFAQDYSKCG